MEATYQGIPVGVSAPSIPGRLQLNNMLPVAISNLASGGAIGTAAATVDNYDVAIISQTTATQLLSNPTPTDTARYKTFRWYNAGSVPLWSTYGQFIPVGGFADQVYIPGTGWKGIGANQPQIIYMSGTSVTFPSDTNENNVGFVTIPGGFMGTNSVVNISTIFENTSGTSSKTVKIKFGAFNPYSASGMMNAATSSLCLDKPVIALNSTSAQITQAQLTFNGSAGASTTLAPPTGTVDTAADVLIECSVQKVTGGDTTTLRSARVTFSYGG